MSRKLVKPWISALRATRLSEAGGECFAPCIHVCFAQLRAETAKNAALGPRRFPEIRKIVNSRPPEKSHFDELPDPFAHNFEL